MEDSGSTDDQIRADFRGPGNAILKLAHKNFQATTVINSCHIDDLGKKEPFWLQGWPDLTPELRNYRVRGAIFDTVLDAYFRKPYFGLDGRTERALRDFECSLKKNGERFSPADMVEWRRRTVTAAQALRPIDEIPHLAAKGICEIFMPIFTPPSNGPTTTPYPEILELCEKAERISLILRQSRATFTVSLAPKDQTIDQPEDSKMELVAVEGLSSSISVKVRHTVFGGLVKTTSFPGEEDAVMTLEKPIVVGYYA